MMEVLPVESLFVKEELVSDFEHEEGDHNKESQTRFRSKSRSEQDVVRHRRRLADEDKKKRLARVLMGYPYLWDRDHKLYRSRSKRELAWLEIAKKLHIKNTDVKILWKKLKDSHRYLNMRAKKKAKFNPYDFCEDNDDEYNTMVKLKFFENMENSRRSGSTSRITRKSSPSPPPPSQDNVSSLDESNVDDSNCNGDDQDNCDVSMIENQEEEIMETYPEVTPATHSDQITSSDLQQEKGNNPCCSNNFKHSHIWIQLEKLFENLDDEKITDLNFLFVSETYKAILDKRKLRNPQ